MCGYENHKRPVKLPLITCMYTQILILYISQKVLNKKCTSADVFNRYLCSVPNNHYQVRTRRHANKQNTCPYDVSAMLSGSQNAIANCDCSSQFATAF